MPLRASGVMLVSRPSTLRFRISTLTRLPSPQPAVIWKTQEPGAVHSAVPVVGKAVAGLMPSFWMTFTPSSLIPRVSTLTSGIMARTSMSFPSDSESVSPFGLVTSR
jgi:hypothetical protein